MSRLDEKRFTALGQEWIARFDFNATCAIEDETGESFYAVAAPFLEQMEKTEEGEKPDPAKVLKLLGSRHNSRIRLMLFHALGGAEAGLTIKQTGEIIGDLGLQGAMEVVLWAIAKGLGGDVSDEGDEGNVAPLTLASGGNRKARKAAAKAG